MSTTATRKSASSKFQSPADMLAWQWRSMIEELQELQRHLSDPSCPCILADSGEFCGPKHALGLHTLAKETVAMSPKDAEMLEQLAEEALAQHIALKDRIVCSKPHRDEKDTVEWSRQWRKRLEPIYYACSVKAHLKQEPAHCYDAAQKPQVTISGKCQGKESCTLKVKASESVEAVSSIGGLTKSIEDVLKGIEANRAPAPSARTFAVGPTTLTKYELEHVLVEADSLIVSHNPVTFEPNPAYPPELQPRLRGRQANRSQVQQIAKSLDADVLLTDYHSIDRGAPIIGPTDNVVESGNGRTMAIQLAVSEFPESYAQYRAEVMTRAASLGLSEDKAKSMTHPVVARRRLTDVPRRQFVEEANASTTLAPSAIEIARSDASHLTLDMVAQLWVGEDQGIEDALRSLSNGQFVSAFLATVPANERAQITDSRGQLNQDGIRRMVMALFVNAFPGDSGLRLAEKFFESTEPSVRNVFNGIAQALGKLAKSEALCRSNARDLALAIGEDLAAAVVAFSDIKKTPGMTVPNYLSQSQMFERRLNPFQERLLKLIDERAKSGKKIGQLLKAYSAVVIESPPPAQGSLIPSPALTKDAALDAAIKRGESEEQTTRLFQHLAKMPATQCSALAGAVKTLQAATKSLQTYRGNLVKSEKKLETSMNICRGQSAMFQEKKSKAPTVQISGKCGDKAESCTFTLKRQQKAVKAKGIDEALTAIDKLSKPCTCADLKQGRPIRAYKEGDTLKTGEPISITYQKNLTKSPSLGKAYGQHIEPTGEYVTYHDVTLGSVREGWLSGIITFRNPLVMEYKSTGVGGWKTDLSKMFGGKTGRVLTSAIIAAGYDGIITIEEFRGKTITSEIVNINGEKEGTTMKHAKMEICPACILALASDAKGKPSPAPWHANTVVPESENLKGVDIMAHDGTHVAVAYGSANAKLLAAAPQLQASLEGTLEELEIAREGDTWPTGASAVKHRAEAALDKSRGDAHMHSSGKAACTPSQAKKREQCTASVGCRVSR
jgi:hypothetical protein